ncbi:HvfC/BufC N-terminal domain-containing protein [Vibrio marisflavi]|uniref:Putative DNA-binding domain-containing protein n=1 Tax=Vibrio marisflavi CECT 7928 TaxID=634439 RepID=A0ABM9A9F1_9VIBR|nr:DNA-binding domain-containing protein [Vibrio marisflavi]CAH0542090.1 hypothetical protein VMF7928_04080 [Vibrio marisflavi CECT 7928]
MSLSLSELQTRFAQALHYQANGNECDIVDDEFSAEERMQIYRNNFVISLSEVLQATYPMVYELVGEECFTQLARQYVLTHPLEHGDVTYYGDGFADVFQQFPNVINSAPYLADVAQFEWQIDLSNQRYGRAEEQPTLMPLAQLSEVEEAQQGNLLLVPFADVVAFKSKSAVFSLQQAIKSGDFESLDINQPEWGVIKTLPNGAAWCSPVAKEQIELLDQLHYRKSLSEIEPHLLSQLQSLIELNLVEGFTLVAT